MGSEEIQSYYPALLLLHLMHLLTDQHVRDTKPYFANSFSDFHAQEAVEIENDLFRP